MSNSSVCSILDMPDEILVMIILHFDARERLPLGNSCQRLNDLVFGDEKLLRNLDFTREKHLVEGSHIQKYFNNENTYKKILRINTECVGAVRNLSISISKAINLVELNILSGLEFYSVEELSRFLKPLVYLKRLSFDWPQSFRQTNYDKPEWNEVLKEPFNRLTYLSLKIYYYKKEFLLILQLCKQLEELCMLITSKVEDFQIPLRQELMKLSNLKSIRLITSKDSGLLRRHIMCIVPDPAEWTDFYLTHPDEEIYLERNVEVCSELSRIKEMPLPDYAEYYRRTNSIDKGWALVSENVLNEVIRVTHEDAPEKFCCLSWSPYSGTLPPLHEIDEAKKLLKDPQYQIRITHLHYSHIIEKNCDVHLFASALPNLTTLVLSGISNSYSSRVPEKTEPFRRRLRKKESPAPKEDSDTKNTDSSFKMLVENTPSLKVLEICPEFEEEEEVLDWDVGAWDQISGWKNLTVIRLCDIPITDGKFLIDIGKECEELQEVTLHRLSPREHYNYESELLQMLPHCKNLRKLSIQGMSLEQLAEMLNILSNCSRLAALRLPTINKESDPLKLTSSVDKMLRQCHELKLFSIYLYPHRLFRGLKRDIERTIIELDLSNFRFDLRAPDLYQENFSKLYYFSSFVPFPRYG